MNFHNNYDRLEGPAATETASPEREQPDSWQARWVAAENARPLPRQSAGNYLEKDNSERQIEGRRQSDARTEQLENNRHPGQPRDKAEIKGLKLLNEKEIKSITLPDGWLPEKSTAGALKESKTSAFNPQGSSDARLAFYDRGVEISANSAADFKDLLSKEAHSLVKDGQVLKTAELKQMQQVLGTMSDPEIFALEQARTETLNGKRVFMVEGRFQENGRRYHGIMFPANAAGSEVQEMFFSASKENYDKYIGEAARAFASVEWHKR